MAASFSIVPVLDLKAGRVVHARAGERARYKPIETPLAETSEPLDVVAGLLSLAPFRRLYIADLDAIEGTGLHAATVAQLARSHPDMQIWLDCGIADADAAVAVAKERIMPVLGSESIAGAGIVEGVAARLGADNFVLSLDYRGESFMGPPVLEQDSALWPQNLIVMTLARVGGAQGPDFDRLASVQARAATRRIWAAGGVRGAEDVRRLAAMGIAGALVATALHDGRLSRATLAGFV